MADTKKHIRVFLASPGDLQEERVAANEIVDQINKMFSDADGYHVDLIGWEDTLPRYGRAQEVINQDLETCELFIGMIWERWGTPPSKEGPYTSGFEEEYGIAITRRRRDQRPELFIFLKDMDPKLLRDPGEDTTRVLAFRNQLISGKEIKFETFNEVREFERKLMLAIVGYVQKLVKSDREKELSESQSTPPDLPLPSQVQELPAPDSPLSAEGAAFLREFLALTEKGGGNENIGAVDVARFRLLSGVISKQGNDEESLGVHDANLLFAKKDSLLLGSKEIWSLLRAGLDNYEFENVPLWHWYKSKEGFAKKFLCIQSLGRATKSRTGALAAMALIDEPLPNIPDLGRDLFLKSWFENDSPSQVKVAALKYLGECGLAADIPKIEAELIRGDYQTRDAALEAIVRIHLREGRQKAFDKLFELQPDQISGSLLRLLLENAAFIGDETVLSGVNQRNDAIRRACVSQLAARNILRAETAEKLLGDNDSQVRLIAIKTLRALGKAYSEAEAKSILVRHVATALLGYSGTTRGDDEFTEYQSLVRSTYSDEQMEELIKRASIFDRSAECTLFERHFNKEGAKLRQLVEDRYQKSFAASLSEMSNQFGEDSQLVKDTQGLAGHLRNKFVRGGLDVILRKSNATALPFVRKHLADDSITCSEHDLEYLGNFGEWQDIPLIVSLVGRYVSAALLLSGDEKKYGLAAKSLLRIGKGRTGELIGIEMPSALLAPVIHGLTDREFKALQNDQVGALLDSQFERVRKITALKSVRCFSKKRLIKTLDDYINSEKQRYYNVVHWLDLGASAPRDVALHAATKALAQE